jgi:tRNA modification GTPase
VTLTFLTNDTIVAIATPPGKGGIGVIRLSGPKAAEALTKVFRGRREVSRFESHRLYRGRFLHPETEELLDEGLAVWMRAPHSFTGEDVVEVQVHGGPLLLSHLLETFVQLGLRPAEPGEFTRRAFLNGKMDLLQAEAVAELIHAGSEAALKNAKAQVAGRLSGDVRILRERLVRLLAQVEAAIDFPEEDIETDSREAILRELRAIRAVLGEWLERFALGRLLREGVRLALIGRPNVGKSSLLNRLLGEERAIVHHRPGTTRDLVEGAVSLGGVLFQVFDTAGIRVGEEEVEQEGMRRSRKAAAEADLTLWVLDGSDSLREEDRLILTDLPEKVLVVANKRDLGTAVSGFPVAWQIPQALLERPWVRVSAVTGEGMDELKRRIMAEVGLDALEGKAQACLNNARHRRALVEGNTALSRAESALTGSLPAECLAADLRAGAAALGALLGAVSSEDILDKIFAEFCVGK